MALPTPFKRAARRGLTVLLASVALLLTAPVTSATAEQASSVPGTGRVLAGRIDAGGVHTCAVLDNGSAQCWGLGLFGQLGYGSQANVGDGLGADVDAAGPIELGTGRTTTAIAAADVHSCALLDDATVRCWGAGDAGRLGYGNETNIGDDPGETPSDVGPVDLGAGRTATAITAGADHTCALLDNGTVRCWGSGVLGRLGYGNVADIGDNETPGSVGPVDLGAGRTATAVTAGADHTCALLDNGTVRCWGLGVFGQLGYGNQATIGDGETPGSVSPVDLGAGRFAIAIAAGRFHTCAVLDNGSVRCWGNGLLGQLGYGNVANIGDGETPGSVSPVDLGGGRSATAITAGGDHTCAVLDNGTVHCWGEGAEGQLGYGDENNIGDDPGEAPGTVGPVALGGRVSVAPGAPLNPTATLTGATDVTITWGAPDPGSAPPLEYRVTSDPALLPVVTSSTTTTFRGLADGTYTFTVTARNGVRAGLPATSNPVVVGSAPSPPGSGDAFEPVSPVRVLDTRSGLGAAGPLAAEATLALSVPGVPPDATAVVINVTVTEPDRDGFLTVWPCGSPRPLTSNLNFAEGENRPNLVVATRGAGGQVCFSGNAATQVVADLAGWYEPFDGSNARYNPLTPERLVDTRTAGPVTAAAPLTVTVVGGPVPAGASAVMLNVTAVEPDAAGFLTVWPCDQAQPVVSNVNYTAGQIVPNAVAVKTSPTGTVCVASFAPSDVVVDRVGWFGATGDLYQPADPVRVLDTRSGVGTPVGKLAAEDTLSLTVPGLAPGTTGVIVNVTATEPDGDGFVTVWPCGQPRPLASTLNVVAGQLAVPNLAAVAIGPGNQICLSGNTATHLVADLAGTYHP